MDILGTVTQAVTVLMGALPSFVPGVLTGKARWLYQGGFTTLDLPPRLDPLGLGPLRQVMTANLVADAGSVTSLEAAPALGPEGAVRLSLTRPASITNGLMGFGAAVYPLPQEYRILRISATFFLPEGPHGAGDSWAVVVHAGEGSDPDPTTGNSLIAVTLQSAFNTTGMPGAPGARMNTVGGALPGGAYGSGAGAGPWLNGDVFTALFPAGIAAARPSGDATGTTVEPPLPRKPVFTLEVDLYRGARIGYARLFVHAWDDTILATPGPGYPVGYVETRAFIHPLLDADKPIDAAGFLVGIAQGDGPARVTVHDFRVYGLTGRDYMDWLLSATRGEAVLAELAGGLGRILVDHAVAGLGDSQARDRDGRR